MTRAATQSPHVAVVGAGAFGGWTALWLRRRGARVTLLDAWGPGNARSSSGGETRVIRGNYGDRTIYTRLVARALPLWREHERRWGRRLLHAIGVLWLVGEDDRRERAAAPAFTELGLPFEELSVAQAGRRYPQIRLDGVRRAFFEPQGGYLTARAACAAVLEGFLAEGGDYRPLPARPPAIAGGRLAALELPDGSSLAADRYVFACGPWLGALFPDAVGERVRPTRQEVFFFGTPAGDPRFAETGLPVWIDESWDRLFYGVPGNEWRGFKIADDTRGPVFDPTGGDRSPTAEGIRAARDYLAHRFPALAGAPLLEARVCQYENTPDSHLILDRHPDASNVWLLGGGSGHGFKLGPALGELAADQVLERGAGEPAFSLARFREPARR